MFDKCKIANLDLQSNPITSVEFGFFSVVVVHGRLFPACDLMCCMLPTMEGARAWCQGFDGGDSCQDQLISPILNYTVWLIIGLCILLNVIALVRHYMHGNKSTPLLLHVFIADIATAAYLCIMGATSISYKDVFVYHKLSWPSGIRCQIASVVSFISLEVSSTLVFVVELQHMFVAAYPFRVIVTGTPRVCTLVGLFSWSLWVIVGWLPHVLHYFGIWQISLSTVCLYHDLGQLTPWKPIFAGIFVGLNQVLSISTVVCCCITYQLVMRTNKSAAARKSKYVMQVKKRMLFAGTANIVGAAPIMIINVLTFCGITPSELMWAISATIIIPIFTIINPMVYM